MSVFNQSGFDYIQNSLFWGKKCRKLTKTEEIVKYY